MKLHTYFDLGPVALRNYRAAADLLDGHISLLKPIAADTAYGAHKYALDYLKKLQTHRNLLEAAPCGGVDFMLGYWGDNCLGRTIKSIAETYQYYWGLNND